MKKGDLVEIIEDLSVDEYDGISIVPQMLQYAGQTAHIEGVRDECYLLDIDGKRFLWPKSIIKPYTESVEEQLFRDQPQYSTKDLVLELKTRGGVQSIDLPFYDKLELQINSKSYPLDIGSNGPAIILIVDLTSI